MLTLCTALWLFQPPANANTGAHGDECKSPNYIKEVVDPLRAPGVTAQDIEVLRGFLAKNDRAGMYLMLYRLTGEEFWLMDAQITTFSGIWGGTALEANYQIKLRNQSKYDDSIDKFSLKIATNMLKWVEMSVDEGNKGIVDIGTLLMKGDGEVWKSKGLLNEYPGRVLFFNLFEYRALDFRHTMGSGSYFSAVAVLKRGGMLGKRPADYAGNSNFTIYTSKEGRFVTVIDNRTGKVEAFIDKDARPLGMLTQITDVALTENDPEYYERLWTWEFMQGNQDTAQEYNAGVWQNGRPLPNPNIKGNYFFNTKNNEWQNQKDKSRVENQALIAALNDARERSKKFRESKGFPALPQQPGRY
ncbi:hypothetical protein ACLVWU_13075 [Bdellovibrio sp. HCB290]|uniref:hypothetical protein n=1 Tax=Bdellovibrio sp. HCB290 TaxID=3394356 RepID=UPI0039B3FCA0